MMMVKEVGRLGVLGRGAFQKSSCPSWEGSAVNFPALSSVLEGQQIASDHLFSTVDNALQSAFVLDSGSSAPDGDGGGEDGFSDGGVEVHYHYLWQIEFLQLLQEVHALLNLLSEAAYKLYRIISSLSPADSF